MPLRRLHQRLLAAAGATGLVASSWRHGAAAGSTPAPGVRADPERVLIRWPATYEWPQAAKWVDGLRRGLAAAVPLQVVELEQPYEGAVVIEAILDGTGHLLAIDYFDNERVLPEVLDACSLVFKMQYRISGYGDARVVPGGYVPGRPYLYRYLPGLRHMRDSAAPRFDAYGRFSLGYAPGIRRTAVELLKRQRQFAYEGDLALRPYSIYLAEAARSRVCVDLPGRGDLTHRLIDYLAIGCAVVRPAPSTRLPEPLADGVHLRYVAPDLSDLVDVCDELVHDSDAGARIGRAAREYFDRHLRAPSLSAHYLQRLMALAAPIGPGRRLVSARGDAQGGAPPADERSAPGSEPAGCG